MNTGLERHLQTLASHEPAIIGLCGLPGAGKTTLCASLARKFADGHTISADDFCVVPTSVRKNFLLCALAQGDENKLRYLAKPAQSFENPYADPRTWYDWHDLARCLHSIRAGTEFVRRNAWNQVTGECDKTVLYSGLKRGSICFLDSIFLYEQPVTPFLSYKMMIELDTDTALKREIARDSHRSEPLYMKYKQIVDEIYCKPYLIQHAHELDQILSVKNGQSNQLDAKLLDLGRTGPS